MDLATLLDRCRQGDDLAWEAFVRQFQGRVYSITSTYTGHPEEARDLAQDVFIRLYETKGRWVEAEVFVPWLIRVSRNLCLDHLRRKKARPPAEDVLADEMVDLAATGATPESELAASRDRHVVWRAVRSLGRLSREMILLKEIQGLTFQEIAASLGVPVGTVKSRSNRARLELAERVLALERGGTVGPEA
ncbi:MAG: sigma-70 family RNA polymerase sigma factor [Acidobacteria bacterium]|nr:MAG: sigma-70 family RNA polymerase sigma factor [Acidobacteriota bacterium]